MKMTKIYEGSHQWIMFGRDGGKPSTDKSYVYDFAQKRANSGFLMIENMIQNENPISVELKLLVELDELYEKNVHKKV